MCAGRLAKGRPPVLPPCLLYTSHIAVDAAGETRLPGIAEDQAALQLGDRLGRDIEPLDANRFTKGEVVEASKSARVLIPVSYTHLDVYKRQVSHNLCQ